MGVQALIKQPAEELQRAVAFDTQAAIAAIVDVAAVKRSLVVGSANLVVAGNLVAGKLIVTMSGGTDGESYLVTARADDADGQTLEAELDVAVIDAAWAMPDGGAGYLSIAEFVARFGLEEVVRMTDTAGTGRIDRAYLINAFVAIQSQIDVHLSASYAVPLATVPEVVKTAMADGARARLYHNGAPDGLAGQAALAMKLIERIGRGELPLPSAIAIEASSTATPIAVSPGSRQYPDGLADY